MEIIEVCEGRHNRGAHERTESVRKNRLFTIMEKYYSYDGVSKQYQIAKRFSQSPQRALPLSEKIGKNFSDPQKKKEENCVLHNGAVKPKQRKHKKVTFKEDRVEEKQKNSVRVDLLKIEDAGQDSSNNGKMVAARLSKVVPSPIVEVNLAAVAIELRVKVRAADMAPLQQERAFRRGRECVDGTDKISFRHVALTLKKEFDRCYGPAWHCIVGRSFGSFVTHSSGGFLYFSMDKLSILLFKTAVEPIEH